MRAFFFIILYHSIKMSDWEKDEYPWLEKSDPWFRRSYIGDTEIVEITRTDGAEKRIAVFYDSEGEREEIDVSDISDGEEEQSNVTGRSFRLRLKRTRNGFVCMSFY